MNYVSFEYIIYCALENLLKYEINTEVSIDTLKAYRKKVLEKVTDYFKDFSKRSNQSIDFNLIDGQMYFTEINEDKQIQDFLEKNSDICYLHNNVIKIKDKVSILDIEEKRENSYIESTRILNAIELCIIDDFDVLSILGKSKLRDKLLSCLNNEEQLEMCYKKLSTNNDVYQNDIQIDIMQTILYIFFNKVSSLDIEYIRSYVAILSSLYPGYKKNEFQFNLVGDKEVKDSFFLSQYNNLRRSCFFRQDVFLNAIFSDKSLSFFKIYHNMEKIGIMKQDYYDCLEEDLFEEEDIFDWTLEDCDEDYYDYDGKDDVYDWTDEEYDYSEEDLKKEELSQDFYAETVFYLKYIDKINNYFLDNVFDEKLNKVKFRLLYVLDNPMYKLYINNNFEKVLEQFQNLDYNYDELYELSECAKAFFVDVFENTSEDDLTLRKLLFISTYYELTQDENMIKEMEYYKEHPQFEKYSTLILGKENRKKKIKK